MREPEAFARGPVEAAAALPASKNNFKRRVAILEAWTRSLGLRATTISASYSIEEIELAKNDFESGMNKSAPAKLDALIATAGRYAKKHQ